MVATESLTEIASLAPNVLIQMARDKGVVASLGLRQQLFHKKDAGHCISSHRMVKMLPLLKNHSPLFVI
jgi:hypothetical protein